MSVAPVGHVVGSARAQREAIAAAVLADPPPLPGPADGVLRTFGGDVLNASRSRPVVRWVVSDRSTTGVTQFTVVGKVYGKGGGEAADALLRRLRRCGFDGSYAVPASLGYVRHRQLLLQTEAPAGTLHDGLADLRASMPDVRRAGGWLARMHAVTGTTLRPLDATFEARKAEEYIGRLAPVQPHLVWRLRDIQRRLMPMLDAASRAPLVPTHGDYQPKNVHLDAARIVVIDFDRAALAPAARDLGHFIGQALTMAAAAGQPFDGDAERWASAFLDGYLAAGGSRDAAAAAPAYVARTFLEVLFYRLVVRPMRDDSFASAWVDACASWLERTR